MEGAKLMVFASLNEIPAPQFRGLEEFLYGRTYEQKKLRIQQYLTAKSEDITDVIDKYLLQGQYKDVVFGNTKEEEVLQKMTEKGWKIDNSGMPN